MPGRFDLDRRGATLERRRVLFVLPSLGGGGAERAVLTLLSHLDRLRFEPHLALLQKSGPYLKQVSQDVPVHDLKASRVRYAIPAIVRLAWKLRPHVLLSALRELNIAMILAKPLLPPGSKLMIQEVIAVSAYLEQESRHQKIWGWLYRRFYPRAEKIICVADYILDDLAQNFSVPRAKMVRVHYWVDVDGLRRSAAASGNPYSGAGPQIVAAGRLTRQKGFDLLLEAMGLVRKALPSARLTILGEGPLELELKTKRDALGLSDAVRLAGFESNPYPYFQHADLFVLSSRFEGLPNVVLEALALGTPVVAIDSPGGAREVVAGCTMGWLVPHADAQHLAQAVISALNSRRKTSQSAEDIENIISRFRIERVVSEYEKLLSA